MKLLPCLLLIVTHDKQCKLLRNSPYLIVRYLDNNVCIWKKKRKIKEKILPNLKTGCPLKKK